MLFYDFVVVKILMLERKAQDCHNMLSLVSSILMKFLCLGVTFGFYGAVWGSLWRAWSQLWVLKRAKLGYMRQLLGYVTPFLGHIET